jgi:Meckel syndrome type 1 protein
MNSGNPKFERDFEAFLRDDDSRLAALYRKLPQPEPDAKLDAAVRALARRAAATPAPAQAAKHRRWLPAFGVAAVLALAAGFAFRLGPQLWQRPSAPAEAGSVAAPSTPATAANAASARQKALAPATPQAAEAQAPAAMMDKAENAASRPAPRAFPAPAPAAPQPQRSTPEPASAAPVTAPPADAASAGAPTPALAAPAAKDRNATLYPEHWLAKIRQLLRDDQREEALRSLAAFRKRYPDYPLPDDLRGLQ